MERYICIHGHFYQPPRENAWLEAIELQDSAHPYHDWNERISAECYDPNATSRILDGEDRIISIVNNYAKISFDFGPTLLSWLEAEAPEVYEAVLEADRESRRRFAGHGSALAQAYNHMILPLASRRDKRTQAIWGIRDFERRFGRSPEGMWLPETAVDAETLEVLAELGIRFTILAPSQARRMRRIGGRAWRDVSGGRIDPTQPYEIRLPSGRTLALFFYDGPISRAVAFEGLLNKGEDFAGRLVGAFSDDRDWPQLVHIATDGETYGHHHRYGDMALAYALHHIETHELARLTNYGEYLERHPPTHQVEILENTAWSCVHGVGRWWQDCGCHTGGHPGWKQAWRTPLRNAFDWLRDELAPRYEAQTRGLLKDPWAARDDYVEVILDRGEESRRRFLERHAARELAAEERVRAWKLLELQRHAQLMYTSCGWFFDDLSGIETVQVIQYAGAAIQLAQQLFGDGVEEEFLRRLTEAKSNVHDQADGARVYEKFVKPAMIDLPKVAAHYAISSLVESYGVRAGIYCYTVDREACHDLRTGNTRLIVGRARFTSGITGDASLLSFAVLHFGDHNVTGGVREFRGQEAFDDLLRDVRSALDRADIPAVIRAMDRHFGDSHYSLKSLFRDEQRKIVNLILESTLSEAAAMYGQVYEHHAPLMRFLGELGVPLPRALAHTAEFVINSRLRAIFREETLDVEGAQALLEAVRRENVALDRAELGYLVEGCLERLMRRFRAEPGSLDLLRQAEAALDLVRSLPFAVRLWQAQNFYYALLQTAWPEQRARGGHDAEAWVGHFAALGEKLKVRMPPG